MQKHIKSSSIAARLDERRFGRTVRTHIREFGAVIALVLCCIAAYGAYVGSVLSTVVGLLFAALVVWAIGAWQPRALYHAWKGWMRVSELIGAFVTGVILLAVWLALLLPTALLLRLIGKRVMNMEFRSQRESYWETREDRSDDFKLMERQY